MVRKALVLIYILNVILSKFCYAKYVCAKFHIRLRSVDILLAKRELDAKKYANEFTSSTCYENSGTF